MELTRESPAPGIVCFQPRRGYRYGVEAYALATFCLDGAPAGGFRTAIDLGAGSGIVALLLASQGLRVIAVERDERWRGVLEASVQASAAEVDMVWGDVRTVTLPRVDVVVCNPPWYSAGRGSVSPDGHKAAARSTLHGAPEDFVAAGLRCGPAVCVVLPKTVGLPEVAGAHLARSAAYGGLVLGEYRQGAGRRRIVEVAPYSPWSSRTASSL